ncbi:tetratricopeptide repeat protein [Rhizobium ruizarguesonis]|uniref:tetratricopeptide repeat protein n=1 Tax=Rhizobium ruizarguesonis TaxID=2081791 RepID=UPI001031EC8F|nr:tetratricopeptide repeat protein [Rhizobium ruizarguesonis]TAX74982.1 tetratricopeptide repeat protein [Rhizobium ruizarguesonis]
MSMTLWMTYIVNFMTIWRISNPLTAGQHFAEFQHLTLKEKAEASAKYIGEMLDAEIFPIFIDDSGDVLQDDGDYQEYFPIIIDYLQSHSRPTFGVIQSRMMKKAFKNKYPRAVHIPVSALSDETVFELMCLKLKDLDIDFDPEKVRQAQRFTDGHPFNVNLVTAFIAEEGIDALLYDPSEIIESKAQRGHAFLRRIDFDPYEADLIALLHEYHSCELEFALIALGRSGTEISNAIRHLEDYCCIERRDTILTIAPPIRDAVRRDNRFRRSTEWLTEVGRRVVGSMEEFGQSDSVSLSFIGSALPELLRQKKEIPFVTALILPTHFLRVARDFYDRSRWPHCVEFASRALEGADRLTNDAKIEANRLLGLALTRINPRDKAIDAIVQRLRGYANATAGRVAFFIEGFRARRMGHYDAAVKKFEEAAKLGRENYHINRELSHVLCRQERFVEAEPYARAAYNRSPDNPYIVDVLLEALEGKRSQSLPVDGLEIERLNEELNELCVTGGFHFHAVRKSRSLYAANKQVEAINVVNAVVKQEDPDLLFRRGQMYVRSSDFKSARKDLSKLYELGGKQPETMLFAHQLEVECLIGESRFAEAKREIENHFAQVATIERNLSTALAKAIAFAPGSAANDLRQWARNVQGSA